MSNINHCDAEWHKSKHPASPQGSPASHHAPGREISGASALYSRSLLNAPSLGESANLGTRAATMLGMQRTQGNNALRRSVQRQSVSSAGGANIPVQQGADVSAEPVSSPGPPGPGWEPIPGTKNTWGTQSPTMQFRQGPVHNLPPFENGPTDVDGNPMPSSPGKEAPTYAEDQIGKAGDFVSSKMASLLDWF